MTTPTATEPPLAILGGILQFERLMRQAESVAEAQFQMVNGLRLLLPYRQAVLWWQEDNKGGVAALSGLPAINREAPMVQWLETLLPTLAALDPPRPLALPPGDQRQGSGWEAWFPAHGFWLPLPAPDHRVMGGLLLVREDPWLPGEHFLLEHLASELALVWWSLRERERKGWRLRFRPRGLLGLFLAVGLLLLPVRQSVLAPAQVIPEQPIVIRSPLDGVVAQFHVQPNQPVTRGTPLLSLDPTTLENRLEVAKKELELAWTDYRQTTQKALHRLEDQARLAVLKSQWEKQQAEVTYLEELRSRIIVRAPQDGMAVFSRVDDWIGRPVVVGERLLTLADPRRMAIEVWLPVGDAIHLESGTPVAFFLNTEPQSPIPGAVEQSAYQAEVTPDGVLAYRVKAVLAPGVSPPRLGLRGTVRIDYRQVTLAYYLLRRPLAAVRPHLGW